MNSQQAISLIQQLTDIKKNELSKEYHSAEKDYRVDKVKKIKKSRDVKRALKEVNKAIAKVRKEIGKIIPHSNTTNKGLASVDNYYDTYNDSFYGKLRSGYNAKVKKLDRLVVNTKMEILTKSAKEVDLDAFVKALKKL